MHRFEGALVGCSVLHMCLKGANLPAAQVWGEADKLQVVRDHLAPCYCHQMTLTPEKDEGVAKVTQQVLVLILMFLCQYGKGAGERQSSGSLLPLPLECCVSFGKALAYSEPRNSGSVSRLISSTSNALKSLSGS
jgi:hypothetical protein